MRAIISISAVVALGICLSGCAAYEVASTAVGATTSVVGGVADVTGAVVSAPFGSSEKDGDK
jgi:hypothetical protein